MHSLPGIYMVTWYLNSGLHGFTASFLSRFPKQISAQVVFPHYQSLALYRQTSHFSPWEIKWHRSSFTSQSPYTLHSFHVFSIVFQLNNSESLNLTIAIYLVKTFPTLDKSVTLIADLISLLSHYSTFISLCVCPGWPQMCEILINWNHLDPGF